MKILDIDRLPAVKATLADKGDTLPLSGATVDQRALSSARCAPKLIALFARTEDDDVFPFSQVEEPIDVA